MEPSSPRKGSKAKVKWGRSIFPASIIEIGSKNGLKKKEKEFHIEKVDEGLNDSAPAKKRKTTENRKEKKGKKKVTILCVTEPNEPDSHTEGECDEPTPPEATCTDESEVPVPTTLPDSDESDLMKQVLEKMQTVQMTLQGLENFVSQQFATMQVIQDVQAAKLIELQNKLGSLECTAADPTVATEECHLSPAAEIWPREILQDVTNFPVQPATPRLSSTPARAQCQLKSAADVIGANSNLLQSVTKAGRLAVKLARDSYFGEDVMRVSTVSGLQKDKLKEIKARLYEVYRFDNLVEFEPLWQKCLIAIGKACQGLRAKDTIHIS